MGLGSAASPARPCGVADTAGALWEPGRVVLLVTAALSMAGFLMGNLFGTSRLLFALGRDGYLPAVIGSVSATHRVPLVALAVHASLACTLAIAGSFDVLALISGGAICLVYALVAVAAISGRVNALTAWGAHLYFWARIVYLRLYMFAVPWWRSLVWWVGFMGLILLFVGVVA